MNKQTQLNRKIQVALTTITDQISANRRFLRKHRRRQMASHWLKMLAIVVGLTGVVGMFAYLEFADPETADWTQMDEKYHLLKNDMYRIGLQVPVTALDGKPVEAEKIVPTEEDQQ